MNPFSALFLLACCIWLCCCSCQKTPTDQPQTSVPPTGPTTPPAGGGGTPVVDDSIRLLVSVDGNFQKGDKIKLEYNDKHQIIRMYNPYGLAINSPYIVYYKNNLIDHIAVSGRETASAIFTYNSNKTCNKVFFKHKPYPLSVDDLFFGDLSDGVFYNMDSLVYSAQGGGIQEIYGFDTYNGAHNLNSVEKFYYSNASDTSLNKIETYLYENGVAKLYDQLKIRTNNINNPAHDLLWFFPFTGKLTSLADKIGYTELPVLFDGPSTALGSWTTYSAKCIVGYGVYNSFGLYNYTTTQFNYNFNADSSRLRVTEEGDSFGSYVDYKYLKVKK